MSEVIFLSRNNVPKNVPINNLDRRYIPPFVDKEKIISICEDNAGRIVVFYEGSKDYAICYWNGIEWHYSDSLERKLKEICKSKEMEWTYK